MTKDQIRTTAIPAKMVTVRDTMEELTAAMEKIQASTTMQQEDREAVLTFVHLSLDLARELQGQTEPFKVLSERLHAQNCELTDRLYKQHISKHQPRGNA